MSFENKRYALAIGKFEGLHRGHQGIIEKLKAEARKHHMESSIMVFWPHPQEFFTGQAYPTIFTIREREKMLVDFGVDHVFTYLFDDQLVNLTAKAFCRKIFVDLRTAVVIVGENYFFGKGREGNVEILKKEAERYSAKVEVLSMTENSEHNGDIISSSAVRELLLAGDIEGVNEMLGFPYHVTGKVSMGRQLGRTIDFPTLNIYPTKEKLLPPDGVYKTRTMVDGVSYSSITNIGLRPTVETGQAKRSIETHLIDLDAWLDMYDKEIMVQFEKHIRPERKFDSLDALKAQIFKDVDGVRK